MIRRTLVLALALCGCTDAPIGAPAVTLVEPAADVSLPVGLEIPVSAQAVRGSGELVALGWTSDLDGELAWAEPDADGAGSATARFDTVGEHVVTVTAFDRLGGEATDSVTVRVRTATAPFLTITAPWSSGEYLAGELLLEVEVQDVEHGPEDLRVSWAEGDVVLLEDLVPDADGVVSQTISAVEGAHEYTATVVDPDGQETSDDVDIDVGPANTDPTCLIAAPTDPALWPQGTDVEVRLSFADAETDVAGIAWTLTSDLDGEVAAGAGADAVDLDVTLTDATHVLTLAGADGFGGSCAATLTVTMQDCDVDGDGAQSTLCSGTDCDDTSADIGPFAGDTAGDGIDGDCDGMDCGAAFASDGAYFVACPGGMDQPSSAQACVDAGYPGLASISDATEEQLVVDLLAPLPSSRVWIGLENAAGAWWSWADGSSAFYRRWIPGEPNETAFPACTEIAYFQGWADQPCGLVDPDLGFVCALRP